jgi:hypothetical protein
MIWEIVILVVLGGAFVVLKVLHSESERKRRLDRAQRDLRMKAATGGFAPKEWDEPENGEEDRDEQEEEEPEPKPREKPEENGKED